MHIFVFCTFCFFLTLSTTEGLTVYYYNTDTNSAVTYQVDTPSIHFKNQHGFDPLTGLQIALPSDRYGCTFKKTEGQVPNTIYIIDEGKCAVQDKFKKAHNAGIKSLIIIAEENQEPGALVHTGAVGIHFSDVIVVEMYKTHGKDLKDQMAAYNVTVDLKDNDKNIWLTFFNSGGLVVWQIVLSAMFLGILAYAVSKMIRFYRKGSTAPTVYISLATVCLSCVLCLLYTLVDPMGSRGVYTQTGLLTLSTIYLPPTFISTFLVSFTLLVTFKAGLQEQSKTVSRVVLFYIALSVISFVLTILMSIIRGEYLTTDQTGSVITALLFILFAITVIIGYGWAFKRVNQEMGTTNFSGNFRSTLRKFLRRNLWVFSALYIAWLIVAIGTTFYFVNLKQTPTGHALSYLFLYMVVALINFYHVLLFEIPKEAGSSSSGAINVISGGTGQSRNSNRESRVDEEL